MWGRPTAAWKDFDHESVNWTTAAIRRIRAAPTAPSNDEEKSRSIRLGNANHPITAAGRATARASSV